MILQTWQLVVVALAGWMNQQQQDIVACLSEENRVLREQLKGKRIRCVGPGMSGGASKPATDGRLKTSQ